MQSKDMVFIKEFSLKAEKTLSKPLERLENSGNEDLVFVKNLIKDTSEIKEMIEDMSFKINELRETLEEDGGNDE